MGSSEHRPICISFHISTRPICGAVHTDAFTLDWATFRGYAFPPFSVIGRCLQLIQSQRVEHLVIVTPVWPTQTWYPLLLTLCIDFPILLPIQKDLLTREGRNHPLPQLQLAGWLLSTVATKREDFLAKTRDILLAAWRKNTTSSYSSAWNKWGSWCSQRGSVNPPFTISK